MKRALLVLTLALAAGLAGAPPDPVAWKAEGPSQAKAGTKFNIKVVAAVQEGWHLYSLKPMAEGPIATRIWLATGQPFSLSGAVAAPEPQVTQDASFGMEVELYEGEVTFTVPVTATTGATPGPQKVVVSASYQTCNNKMCLPPKTVKVEVPVAVVR